MSVRTTCFGSWILAIVVLATTGAHAQLPEFTREADVIYARKFGTALTLDVFTPPAA